MAMAKGPSGGVRGRWSPGDAHNGDGTSVGREGIETESGDGSGSER